MSRALDILLAAVGLVIAAPVLLLAAIAIKLDSRGPALYLARRVGRGGVEFDLYKLRTMHTGNDPVGVGVPVLAGDPRVTRVGDVLRGEMSIVGPRPTLRAQVEAYTPRQRRRLDVKPGLTGWAQVNGRAGIPWDERIELDVWYVDHRRASLDLRILARTVWLVLTGQGLAPD